MSEAQIKNQASRIGTVRKDSRIYDIRDSVQKIEETNGAIAEKSKRYLDQLIVMVDSETESVKNSVDYNQKKIRDNNGIISMYKRLINNIRSGVKNWIGGLFNKSKNIGVDGSVSVIGGQKVSIDNKVSLDKLTKDTDINTIENQNPGQNKRDDCWILNKKAFGERNNKNIDMKVESISKNSKTIL